LASSNDFNSTLKSLKKHHSLIGVRHILDEQAFDILSSQQAQQNFASLNEIRDFIFELQLPLADKSVKEVMPLLIETISNNLQLRFIINHAGFPPKRVPTDIYSDAWTLWQKNITALAQSSNVFIKCSGMEMVDRQYEMSWFSQITSDCIKAFSADRVMLASNFPLCLLGNKLGNGLGNKTYASYWQDIIESKIIKQCSEKEKSALSQSNMLKPR
jgi:predicted TIM-barrel fold metal-dependent hydrolase